MEHFRQVNEASVLPFIYSALITSVLQVGSWPRAELVVWCAADRFSWPAECFSLPLLENPPKL